MSTTPIHSAAAPAAKPEAPPDDALERRLAALERLVRELAAPRPRLRMSATVGAFAGALAKAQALIAQPGKNKTATVPTKAGGVYSYKYADLADCIAAYRPHFAAHGIAVIQSARTFDRGVGVTTLLMHESGEWIESDEFVVAVGDARPQTAGSAATYARRYSGSPIIGIAPDEDDDGQVAQAAADHREQRRDERRSAPVDDRRGPPQEQRTETRVEHRKAGPPQNGGNSAKPAPQQQQAVRPKDVVSFDIKNERQVAQLKQIMRDRDIEAEHADELATRLNRKPWTMTMINSVIAGYERELKEAAAGGIDAPVYDPAADDLPPPYEGVPQ